MDTRVLNYFLMVAKEENITRAAQILHITQPTLSRQLQQLEEELGVELFRRSNHSIYLTSEGILFRRRAQEMVDMEQKIHLELTETKDELTGEVSVGCGEMQSVCELSEILSDFRKLHPKVRYKMQSGNNLNIREWLEQGTLDVGLLLEPAKLEKYEYVRMKQKEEWGILVRRDSPFAEREGIIPGELVGTLVITTEDELLRGELASWSGRYAKNMANLGTYSLQYNAAMLAREGVCPAICLRLNCSYDDLVFIPFSPKIEMSSVLAWKGQSVMPKTVEAFVEFARSRYA